MNTKVLYSLANRNWGRTNATNYSTNGFPTRVPTVTMPSGDGVIEFGGGAIAGEMAPRGLMLLPFGAGASTNTFLLNVLGWGPTGLGVGQPLWLPETIGQFTVTLGTGTGVAGADLTSTALFATTITATFGPTLVTSGQGAYSWSDWLILSPGSNALGSIIVPSFGFPLLEVIFSTGGSATSCNSMFRKV